MSNRTMRILTVAGSMLVATTAASQAFPFFGQDDARSGTVDANNSGQVAGPLPRNEDGAITLRHLRGHQDGSAERAAYRGEISPQSAQSAAGEQTIYADDGGYGPDRRPAGAYGTVTPDKVR